jgi:hypothetical protein
MANRRLDDQLDDLWLGIGVAMIEAEELHAEKILAALRLSRVALTQVRLGLREHGDG